MKADPNQKSVMAPRDDTFARATDLARATSGAKLEWPVGSGSLRLVVRDIALAALPAEQLIVTRDVAGTRFVRDLRHALHREPWDVLLLTEALIAWAAECGPARQGVDPASPTLALVIREASHRRRLEARPSPAPAAMNPTDDGSAAAPPGVAGRARAAGTDGAGDGRSHGLPQRAGRPPPAGAGAARRAV